MRSRLVVLLAAVLLALLVSLSLLALPLLGVLLSPQPLLELLALLVEDILALLAELGADLGPAPHALLRWLLARPLGRRRCRLGLGFDPGRRHSVAVYRTHAAAAVRGEHDGLRRELVQQLLYLALAPLLLRLEGVRLQLVWFIN